MRTFRPIADAPRFLHNSLSEQELYEIHRLWGIERAWWRAWRNDPDKHWSLRGEDGWYEEEIEGFSGVTRVVRRAINMTDSLFFNPRTNQEESIGWVTVERILPWAPGVVPTSINWFTQRYFGTELFGYQLYFYYLCQPSMLLVGGRGSAKTKGLALVAATWVSLHPGQSWAHFAYTQAQAMEAYAEIEDLGSLRFPSEHDPDVLMPSWVETFVKSKTTSPHGHIRIHPWRQGDPGAELLFRPLGQATRATTARSIDVRRTSIDECTYDVEDTNVLSVAEATARGTNTVVESWLPKELRAKVRHSKRIMAQLDERRRANLITDEELQTLNRIEDEFFELGISCQLSSIRTGNRGAFPWIDASLQHAVDAPRDHWAATVSFLINPHLDSTARAKLLSTYDDELEARVELYAERPLGRGLWFTAGVLARCEDTSISDEMAAGLGGVGDYAYERFGPHTVLWRMPYNKELFYVLGCDPGTSMVPLRDAWSVLVWEVDMRTFPRARLACLRWGNTARKQRGSWNPFLEAVREEIERYHIFPQNVVIQVGGQEAGIAETAWGKGQSVSIVKMTQQTKAQMANYARQLMSHRFLRWSPQCADLSAQLSNWEFNDRDIPQDLVMAVFAASWSLFSYFNAFIPIQTHPLSQPGRSHVPSVPRTTPRRMQIPR